MPLLLLLACTGDDADVAAASDTADTAGTSGDAPDPLALAAEVSATELERTITELVAFGTRHTDSDGDDEAAAYLADRLEGLGLLPEVDPFEFRDGASANVIARKAGSSGVVWIFSAHYDSTSELPLTVAPGADDNASAVAAVLEAARILGPRTLRDDVWFVLTGAEEQGARGARHLVSQLEDEGTVIGGVVAPDMIGYWPLGEGDAFDILGDDGSEAMAVEMADVADRLGVANKVWIDHGYCQGDDHTYFQNAGYPAITPMDCVEAHNLLGDETLPHYHQSSDTLETLHLPFTTKVAQVIVGALATWAGVEA